MPGRLGVVQPGVRWERLRALVAVAGEERDDLVEALRWPTALQTRRVSGLAVGLLAGALLGDGPGGARGAGRGREAGVSGVGAQARFAVGDAALPCRDAFVALQTSEASQGRHDAIIGTRQARSCTYDRLSGYFAGRPGSNSESSVAGGRPAT